MKMRIKGIMCNVNMKKLLLSSISTKKEFIKIIIDYRIERLRNYWIGYADIYKQDIGVCNDDNSEMENQLYYISITAGRHGIGQYLSHINYDIVKQLIEEWKSLNKKYYTLHLDLGNGMSQEYTFTRKQINMLIPKLEELLDMKWYQEDEFDE